MRNTPILAAAHYIALAQIAFWMDKHLGQFPWTSESQFRGILHSGLANEISKDITQLMRWEILLANRRTRRIENSEDSIREHYQYVTSIME